MKSNASHQYPSWLGQSSTLFLGRKWSTAVSDRVSRDSQYQHFPLLASDKTCFISVHRRACREITLLRSSAVAAARSSTKAMAALARQVCSTLCSRRTRSMYLMTRLLAFRARCSQHRPLAPDAGRFRSASESSCEELAD